MNTVNEKIINAIIKKTEKVCPDSLALIGIYGSYMTGDVHKKSDLDLLILIKNEEGYKLSSGFILDDSKIGYDIYCTNIDSLENDSKCPHAQLSKLMDSKIVYVKDENALNLLNKLREKASGFLNSEERLMRAKELIAKAKIAYADANLQDTLNDVRLNSCRVIYNLLDALMIYHKSYFKRGTKRTFDELHCISIENSFIENLKNIALSKDIKEIQNLLKSLILYTENHINKKNPKLAPSSSFSGTYEEMFSNWRNKVEEASENNDAYSSFMNMCGLHFMLKELSEEFDIGVFNIMEEYDPENLENNTALYDKTLNEYEKIYTKAGIKVKRYKDIDAFVKDYLN